MGNFPLPPSESARGAPKRSNTLVIFLRAPELAPIHVAIRSVGVSRIIGVPSGFFPNLTVSEVREYGGGAFIGICHIVECLWEYLCELCYFQSQFFYDFELSLEWKLIEADEENRLLHTWKGTREIEIIFEKFFSFLEIHREKDNLKAV